MEKTIEKLKELGLNSYEAKVYLALLKKYPATGYEVAQIADIPQARAYDALKSLMTEHIVISNKEKPQKYTPVPPKDLIRFYKRKINSTVDYLEKKVPSVQEDYSEPIHTIDDYENIIDKLKEVIKTANDSIYSGATVFIASVRASLSDLPSAFALSMALKNVSLSIT